MEDAARIVRAEIAKFFTTWTETQWDEIDWGKAKEMTTREILEQRNEDASQAQEGHCFGCPKFIKHVRLTPLKC